MKYYFWTFIFSLFLFNYACGQTGDFDSYGKNPSAGAYVVINNIQMYYEQYGQGEPLILIHGNGGSINAMRRQIDFFKDKYHVIVADSRGHGKSEFNTDSLTYSQMTNDWLLLAEHLNLDSFNVIGWSDGGIIGLKMAIEQPRKMKKLITMGANIRPDSTAVYSWALEEVKTLRSKINYKIASADQTQDWQLQKQLLDLLIEQPQIARNDLSKIEAPVLVMAGDKDIIREEHSVEIFQNLKRSQLCILPGSTHSAPLSNHALFNQIVLDFLSNPFRRPESNPNLQKIKN